METKSAVKSKTIKFNAIVMGLMGILAAVGVELPDWFYPSMMALVPIINIGLRLVTKGAVTLTSSAASEEGRAGILLIMVILMASSISIGVCGCSLKRSAVGQISSQTNDPGAIAVAAHADAQDAYIAAAELYLPYQAILQQSNPDLDERILNCFASANEILNRWEALGDVPVEDKVNFRIWIREITLELAVLAEAKAESQ